MGRFQSGHEQGKHNAEQRDYAHQLPALELKGSGLHLCLLVDDTACVQVQLTAISTALPMSLIGSDAECSVLGTHESV